MATRHNLCPNPATANNITGWTSNGAAPVRTDVTGLGFARQWAALYSDGSVAFSPSGAATPGLAYTVSTYLRPTNFPINGNIYIEFLDGGGGSLGFSNSAFTAPDGVVTRISQTGTAVAGTVSVHFVVTGENYLSNPAYYSQCLIEQSATLQPYFDGASAGATWDGTAGSSTSTLVDAAAASPPPRSYARSRRALLVR